jgi:peptidyl-prolyl cis-trans isomerase D
MLEMMRSHKFFTVFLLGIITIVITIAFVFYGIGPQQNPSNAIIARVNNQRITLAEYDRAYKSAYRRARETYKDEEEIEKLNLKTRVLEDLIDNIILLNTADEAGIKVSEKELKEAIMQEPAFQVDGVFRKDVYERRLKLNRLNPATFESTLKSDLLLNKLRRMIAETAELGTEETKILESVKGDSTQLREVFLFSKREKAIKAYVQALKRQSKITVNKDYIY